MVYVFDIDNTICYNKDGNYEKSVPMEDRIEKINKLYDEGHEINFLTARGMGRSNNNTEFAYNKFYDLTKNQLDKWGVKYHSLFLGKPAADFYIDDKGISDEDFFNTRD